LADSIRADRNGRDARVIERQYVIEALDDNHAVLRDEILVLRVAFEPATLLPVELEPASEECALSERLGLAVRPDSFPIVVVRRRS
jgi:hypothetical protein